MESDSKILYYKRIFYLKVKELFRLPLTISLHYHAIEITAVFRG